MRDAVFTPEQIIKAGNALQASGIPVTSFALRRAVGGGNVKRLKHIWDEHLASQTVVEIEPMAELPIEVAEQLRGVTQALSDRLTALAVDLNDKAVKSSERRVSEMVRATSEQSAQAEQELADASQAVDDLEQQLDASDERIALLERHLTDAHATNQAQAIELAQVRERLVSAVHTAEQSSQREASLQARLDEARISEQAVREREARAVGALASAEKRHIEDAELAQRLRRELHTTADALTRAEA